MDNRTHNIFNQISRHAPVADSALCCLSSLLLRYSPTSLQTSLWLSHRWHQTQHSTKLRLRETFLLDCLVQGSARPNELISNSHAAVTRVHWRQNQSPHHIFHCYYYISELIIYIHAPIKLFHMQIICQIYVKITFHIKLFFIITEVCKQNAVPLVWSRTGH